MNAYLRGRRGLNPEDAAIRKLDRQKRDNRGKSAGELFDEDEAKEKSRLAAEAAKPKRVSTRPKKRKIELSEEQRLVEVVRAREESERRLKERQEKIDKAKKDSKKEKNAKFEEFNVKIQHNKNVDESVAMPLQSGGAEVKIGMLKGEAQTKGFSRMRDMQQRGERDARQPGDKGKKYRKSWEKHGPVPGFKLEDKGGAKLDENLSRDTSEMDILRGQISDEELEKAVKEYNEDTYPKEAQKISGWIDLWQVGCSTDQDYFREVLDVEKENMSSEEFRELVEFLWQFEVETRTRHGRGYHVLNIKDKQPFLFEILRNIDSDKERERAA